LNSSELCAVYPGSFDPLTLGHNDIVKRSLKIVDRLVLALAETATHAKQPLFDLDEREALMREVYRDDERVEVVRFSGLLVDFARSRGARLIIREYEFQMALMNRSLWPEIEVIFMAPDNRYTFLSSSLVREVARLGGDVSRFVPPLVLDLMQERLGPSVRGG
jgi:pantetheine-phosphate adenylyltransferase